MNEETSRGAGRPGRGRRPGTRGRASGTAPGYHALRFGQAVQEQRERLGLSLRDVQGMAEEAGASLSASYLSQFENQKLVPTPEAARLIARLLNLEKPLREALFAWVDLCKGSEDVERMLRAAQRLRAMEERERRVFPGSKLSPEHPPVERPAPREEPAFMQLLASLQEPASRAVRPSPAEPLGIPVLPTGAEPSEEEAVEWLRLEPALVPGTASPDQLFAWRVGADLLGRVRDRIQPGDVVVFSRSGGWIESPSPHEVWLVRADGRLVLSPLRQKGGVFLLPPSVGEGADFEVLTFKDVMSRVVARAVLLFRSLGPA